jgi:hypothetical protein
MSGIANNLLVTRILYTLERQYKRRIEVVHLLDVVNNVEQGLSIPNTLRFMIQAIVLPEVEVRKHLYNAAYLSMSRNFVQGAHYDELATPMIIRGSRVPRNVKLTTNDYALVDGVRYDFKHVGRTIDDRSYHVLTGQSPMVRG